MQPFREKSLHRYLLEILGNSFENSNRKFQTGMSEFESSLVSQPVRSLEIFSLMSRESPPLAGFFAIDGESPGTKFDIFRAAVPRISAYLRQGGRFLEKRIGDCVRMHCVAGLPVPNRSIWRIGSTSACQFVPLLDLTHPPFWHIQLSVLVVGRAMRGAVYE